MLSTEEIRASCEILKALAHPTRIAVVDYLMEGEQPACRIFNLFNFDMSTISKHLSVLKNAGILSSRKEGCHVIYRLEPSHVRDCLTSVFAIIKEIRSQEHRPVPAESGE
jgi:ArsR family transcriptional regulator